MLASGKASRVPRARGQCSRRCRPGGTRAALRLGKGCHSASRRGLTVVCDAERLNVVMVGFECAPFSKTGGLGDVVSSLPKALVRDKIPNVKVALP